MGEAELCTCGHDQFCHVAWEGECQHLDYRGTFDCDCEGFEPAAEILRI